MKLVKRKLIDLIPAIYNPRKVLIPEDAEYQKIADSIEEFGYVDPIIINSDNTIISGHQRRTVMLDLGYVEADCILVNMDKTREKALNIALNKITGEWNEAALKDLLIDLDRIDYNINLTGFGEDEIEELFAEVELMQEINDDNYDINEKLKEFKLKETQTRPSDIWQLGNHRLMCGDATDISDVERLMEGLQADLIITDPPYNVDYESKDKDLEGCFKRNRSRKINEIQNDNMNNDAFYSFLYQAFSNFYEIARAGCSFYIFHADMQGINFRTAIKDVGFYHAQTLIWEKNHFVLGRQDYQWRHEPILYGWKEGASHYFGGGRGQDTIFIQEDIDFSSMKKSELITYIEGLQEQLQENTTILYEKRPIQSDMHPTMKPVTLFGRLISNSSKYGENVVDFFAGSGTTLIACEQLNRNAYLMEANEAYCDIMIDRWEEYTGQKAIRIREGNV
ncbi:MAG: DNA modification methylase [Lachnospiraceae bacterium]